MFSTSVLHFPFILLCAAATCARNLVLTNDDGWAVASIRGQYEALTKAGFDVGFTKSHCILEFIGYCSGGLVRSNGESVWHWLGHNDSDCSD